MLLNRNHPLKAAALWGIIFLSTWSQAENKEEYVCGFYQQTEQQLGFKSCWSVGVGIGQAQFSPDAEESSWSLDDNQDSAWRVALSYRPWAYALVQLVYADLGSALFTNSNTAVTEPANLSYQAPALFVGGEYPLWVKHNRVLSAHLKIGAANLDNSTDNDLLKIEEEGSVQLAWGAGMRYQFADHWAVSTDFESFSEDTSLASLSLHYLFGGEKRSVYRHSDPILSNAVVPLESDSEVLVAPTQVSDQDQDNVPDDIDQCETDAAMATRVDANGCVRYNGGFVPMRFAHNQTKINSDSTRQNRLLRHYVSILKRFPDTQVTLLGHADSFGLSEDNLQVSKVRAESVRDYLVAAGIAADRITVKPLGDQQPSQSDDAKGVTKQGLSQRHDRRVEVIAR